MPADAVPSADEALVSHAAGRTGLLWVRPAPGGRAWPAWHVWVGDAAYVVSGPGEQELPALDGPVEVVLRSKDTGARLVTVPAEARRIGPEDDDWDDATAALKAERLNATDPDGQVQRWAERCTVTRLRPQGDLLEGPGRYDDASGAAAPAPTPARSGAWKPWHAGGRARRLRTRLPWRRGR